MNRNFRVFVVEDDRTLCSELTELLKNAGYEAGCLSDFSHAKEEILASAADIVLLDIGIPGGNGEQLLREIRRESDVPVIMLTSRTAEIDEVLSMSYGADDYITKPFNPTLLLLRVSAVLRRSASSHSAAYRGLSVDYARGSISDGQSDIVLTKNEMIIFRLMLDRQGEIVTREELMTALWDNDEFVNDNALTVNISRLRQKLGQLGSENAIETRKKQGYILL